MKIFGFSGLGADERVFTLLNVKLEEPITPVPWLPPSESESIEDYAERISRDLTATGEPILIVGISFGGIIATEIAKRIPVQRTILISSASTVEDIPWYFKLFILSNVVKIVPEKYLLPPPFISNWVFSVKSADEKNLLRDIIESTDKKFARWAISRILNWKNQKDPPRVTRIHGTKDRLLPISRKETIKIAQGGHFMIVNRADEIAQVINNIVREEARKL